MNDMSRATQSAGRQSDARPQLTASMRKLRHTTEWSTYTLFAMGPLFIALHIANQEIINVWPVAFLIVQIALATTCSLTVRDVVDQLISGVRERRWPMYFSVALTGVSIVLGVLGFMPSNVVTSPLNTALIIPTGLLLVTLAPIFPTRKNLLFAVGVAGLMGVATFIAHLLHPVANAALLSIVFVTSFLDAVFLILLPASVKTSFTVIREVESQQRLDRMQADLAVADERLRIARDLHDLFGRTLTAVALKSDLAAELAQTERAPQAAAEAQAVHNLANDALKEVRATIAGYREADLAAEVAGATALLASAGVTARVLGEPRQVRDKAAVLLAFVVREGATNIVRHSTASNALIRFSTDEQGDCLEVTNDGVHEDPPAHDGSGLAGLSARIEAARGILEWRTDGHSFVLSAFLPAHSMQA